MINMSKVLLLITLALQMISTPRISMAESECGIFEHAYRRFMEKCIPPTADSEKTIHEGKVVSAMKAMAFEAKRSKEIGRQPFLPEDYSKQDLEFRFCWAHANCIISKKNYGDLLSQLAVSILRSNTLDKCSNFEQFNATSFSKEASTNNIVTNHCEGQVISNNSDFLGGNKVAYDINHLCEGRYSIEVEYASTDSRPVQVSVDGAKMGYHLKKYTKDRLCEMTKDQFTVDIKEGSQYLIFKNLIKDGAIPHIKFIKAEKLLSSKNNECLELENQKTFLNEGSELLQGEYIFSENGRYRFGLSNTSEVELCELDSKYSCTCARTLWRSDSDVDINKRLRGDQTTVKLVMQQNGELGIYAWTKHCESVVICGSGSAGSEEADYRLVLTNNGTAEIRGHEDSVWTTVQGRFSCASQADVDKALNQSNTKC